MFIDLVLVFLSELINKYKIIKLLLIGFDVLVMM